MKHHVSRCLFIMPVQRQNGPFNRLICCKCSPLSLCCTYKSYLSVAVLLLALKYYRKPYTSSDWSVSSARHDTTGSKAFRSPTPSNCPEHWSLNSTNGREDKRPDWRAVWNGAFNWAYLLICNHFRSACSVFRFVIACEWWHCVRELTGLNAFIELCAFTEWKLYTYRSRIRIEEFLLEYFFLIILLQTWFLIYYNYSSICGGTAIVFQYYRSFFRLFLFFF
jgi:hypothetical protein